MKPLPTLGAVAAIAVAIASAPRAGAAPGSPPELTAQTSTTEASCRVVVIPAHTRTVQKTIVEQPLTCEQRVPRYKNVDVPIYETRRIPEYERVEQPVYETREVPVYRTERMPVWGEKEVTAYRSERRPLTIEIPNPFGCENPCLELWDRCEQVPDGTRMVRAVVGHETREVQCGTRLERHQIGTREERVLRGYRVETVQTGIRKERRLDGYETRTVVTRAARHRVVREEVPVPCETVTVVSDGSSRDAPLEGTSRVLTESQLQGVLADVR
jgi:hypothetical protein